MEDERKNIDVECFWCDPLPVADIVLRRYHKSIHDARVVLGECDLPLDCRGAATVHVSGGKIEVENLPHWVVETGHPGWPKKCSGCDYAFTDVDDRVIYFERKFRRADTGEVHDHANPLPVGAMSWTPLPVGATCGKDTVLSTDGDGDGRSIFAVIPRSPDPNRSWHGTVGQTIRWEIDGLAAGDDLFYEAVGRTWTRSGTPPRITVVQPVNSPLGFSGTLVEGRLRGHLSLDRP